MNKDIWGVLFVLSIYILVFIPIGVASTDSCGDEGCHEKEYQQLADSMHSKSWNEPLFQSFYQRAVDSMGEEKAAKECKMCHAPVESNSAMNLMCDFCHVVKITENGYVVNEDMIISLGMTRYGAHEIDDAPHLVEYDPIYSSSEFCKPCHEYTNELGVPLFTTFTEWENSEYGDPDSDMYMTCQDCHMPLEDGIRTHYFGGLHVESMLQGSAIINMTINDTTFDQGENVTLIVDVTNTGVGHDIPSGESFRQASLTVTATNENSDIVFVEQRIYMKQLADYTSNGPVLSWLATRIFDDNRLKALETKTEVFSFKAPEYSGNLSIEAVLTHRKEIAFDSSTIKVTENVYVYTDTNDENDKFENAETLGLKSTISIIGLLAAVFLINGWRRKSKH